MPKVSYAKEGYFFFFDLFSLLFIFSGRSIFCTIIFVPDPQTRPHLVPLYPPLSLSSTSISTSTWTSSDAPSHISRAFPSTTALPLDYTPPALPFLHNLNGNQQTHRKEKPPDRANKP